MLLTFSSWICGRNNDIGSAVTTDFGGTAQSLDGSNVLSNFPTIGATSGIGILRQTGSAVLKAEITALESLGLGKIISKDKNAYTYLTNSVNAFPPKKVFLKKLQETGFKDCKHIPLTFGIVSLYSAKK